MKTEKGGTDMKIFLGILNAILKGVMMAISLFTSWK